MRIVTNSRLAYINPPRTATLYIERVLMKASGNRVFTPSLKRAAHHTLYLPMWRDYHWFISVRHPYTRCVSIWRRLVEHNQNAIYKAGRPEEWIDILAKYQSFEDLLLCDLPFVRNYWKTLPCKHFTAGVPRIDSVVRQESLEADLAKVPGLNSGIKAPSEKKPHASKDSTPWHAWFTSDCVDFVQETFADDFDTYGYNRDFEAVVRGEYGV